MQYIDKTARLSDDGVYRYSLARYWNDLARKSGYLAFVMLNPSTADASQDDPTIRRCVAFANREGYGGVHIANLFAYRATRPEDLKLTLCDPVGPDNINTLRQVAEDASLIVCAWGSNADKIDRDHVRACVPLLRSRGARLACLGKTANGAPRHPLYVRGDQPLEVYP